MNAFRDDVVILGAGVIGLFCALELLERGREVTVIDAGRVGGGSSHGNCGTITPSHATPLAAPGMIGKALRWMLQPDAPLYIRPRFDPALWYWLGRFALRCNARDYRAAARGKAALLSLSRERLAARVAALPLRCEFEESGLSYVYRDAVAFDRALELIRDVGECDIRATALDATQLLHEEPALRPGMAGAIRFPDDAHLRPDRLVAELARLVRERGGVLLESSPVSGFIRDSESRVVAVRMGSDERRAQDIVLACGAWSTGVARGLGLALPVQPGKGYSITYDRPAVAPRAPLVLRERSVCVTAWDSGFRLGSTMEFSGYDTRMNRVRLDALRRGAAEYLRHPEGPNVQEEWYGWRPMTWDDLPVLGRARQVPNLMFATGHGMLGVSMAAGTAALVADLMQGSTPMIDVAPYSPRRFGL